MEIFISLGLVFGFVGLLIGWFRLLEWLNKKEQRKINELANLLGLPKWKGGNKPIIIEYSSFDILNHIHNKNKDMVISLIREESIRKSKYEINNNSPF